MGIEYAEDCIHLHACRRLSKLAEAQFNKKLTRNCNVKCKAYKSGELVIVEDACDVARRLLRDMEYGYSYDDLSVEVNTFMQEVAL